MTTHTPGPWIQSLHVEGGMYLIWAIGIKRVAHVDSESDAHLIAAAPDMLYTLKQVSGIVDHLADALENSARPITGADLRGAHRLMLAVIDKATHP